MTMLFPASSTVAPPTDAELLRAAVDHVRTHDTAALLRLLLPGADGVELRALTDRCRFAHTALLVFPPDADALHRTLADCGLTVREAAAPSTVATVAVMLRQPPL